MNATDLLSQIESLHPAIVKGAKFALAARDARGAAHRWPEWVLDKVAELKAEKLGWRRIAKRLGLPPNTVRSMLERVS